MITGVGKVVKRRVIKISLAIFVVVGILLGLLAALTRDTGPEMSFGFLDGRAMTARIEQNPGRSAYRTTREVYSFQADFNEVLAKVDAELSALGFKIDPFGVRGAFFLRRQYQLANATSARAVVVSLRDGAELKVYATPKSSKYSSPDRYEYHQKNGCVSIEIARRRLRSWPPQYLLHRLQLMWYRANTPPAPDTSASSGR
jgi:hypothetical protein